VAFDPEDFHKLAVLLAQNQPSEAAIRTAISRAYYACHLLGRQRLMRLGWEPKGKGDDHGGVIRELKSRRTRPLGDQLDLLREHREHADYHMDASSSVLNPHCTFCQKIRESPPKSGPMINSSHWAEVEEVSGNLISLLKKL
jgi:hypothetical protein